MELKNIGIFAHVDAGKTTITEQILYKCNVVRSVGSVDSGTAHTDIMPIERERGISVRSIGASVTYKDVYINIIDTPGHSDFAGEVERVFKILDGAVLAVSAVEGVQSHTENLRRVFTELKLPHIIFINKTDRVGSDVLKVFESIKQLGGNFILLNSPVKEGCRDCSVSDLNSDAVFEALAEIYDDVAEIFLDDKLYEKYVRDDKYLQKLKLKLLQAVTDYKITPVICGSALLGKGIDALMETVADFLPCADKNSMSDISAVVYAIEHTKNMGKLSHVRMFGGELKNRDDLQAIGVMRTDVLSHEKRRMETVGKIAQIRKQTGSKYTDIGRVEAGDIAVLCGDTNLQVGDIIGEVTEKTDIFSGLAHPFLTVCVSPEKPSDLPRLTAALRELSEEEPLMNFRWAETEREAHIDLTGAIQLEIIAALLAERYSLNAVFTPPSVIYKETPVKADYGSARYTMPKPCWACVDFYIEPAALGSGVVYDGGRVPNNQLFYKYQEHIKKSFYSSVQQGLLGWEVTDFKCTLTGGEHHTIHTHPLDFFVATPMAFMNGLQNCGTALLEPLLKVKIHAPEEYLGKTISDITAMRGEFDSPVVLGGSFTVECILPVSESLDYPTGLASVTAGRASFTPSFYGYRPCPLELGKISPRRGVNPLDRSKWILWARGAIHADT